MERYWNEMADQWARSSEDASEEAGDVESPERENLVLLIASLHSED